MVGQVNSVLKQSHSFDYRRLTQNISFTTWLKFYFGCTPEPDSYQQLVAELQRARSNAPESGGDLEERRLIKANRLFTRAKEQLRNNGLDIIRMIKSTRRIETLCQVMLTKNQ